MKTVEDLVLTYYSSNDYNMLRDKSKADYKYFLNVLVGEFGDVKYDKLTSKQAKHAYEEWVWRASRLPITCVPSRLLCIAMPSTWNTQWSIPLPTSSGRHRHNVR